MEINKKGREWKQIKRIKFEGKKKERKYKEKNGNK